MKIDYFFGRKIRLLRSCLYILIALFLISCNRNFSSTEIINHHIYGSFAGSLPVSATEQPTKPLLPVPTPHPTASNFDKWLIDIDNLPTVGGIPVAVKPYSLAAWDQPFTRTPGAPKYEDICPGSWEEIHYRNNSDLAQLQIGKQNVRIFIHALKDAAGHTIAYKRGSQSRANCTEFVGVPDADGRKPQIKGTLSARYASGLIIRGFVIARAGGDCRDGQGIGTYVKTDNRNFTEFTVLHNNEFYGCGGHTHFFGSSRRHWPRSYIEMIGNISGYARSHTFYIETSIGRLVYKSNVCFAPGWGHCFKNLAHSSLIEGNVFANAGLKGEAIPSTASPLNRKHPGGMHPLDLYGCTNTQVLSNTIIYRTTANIRNMIAYRARGAWGACDKGRRLDQKTWEYMPAIANTGPATLPPAVVRDFSDPGFWSEVKTDRALFDQSYAATTTSNVLFSHQAAGNKFIVIPAFKGLTTVLLARLSSLRPLVKHNTHPLHTTIRSESAALADTCAGDIPCFTSSASKELLYAYKNIGASAKADLVKKGGIPTKIPIATPANWAERYALFWDVNQETYMCQPDGTACTQWTATMPKAPLPGANGYDSAITLSPPKVILQ